MENVRNLFYPVIKFRFFVCLEFNFPVTLYFKFSVLVNKIVSRRKLINVLEESFRSRRILECKVVFKSCFIEFLFEIRVCKKTLDFRTVHESFAHFRIIKRLYTEKSLAPKSSFLFLSQITNANIPLSLFNKPVPNSSYPWRRTSESVCVVNL